MTQHKLADYVVAYGYSQKFYLTKAEAMALIAAAEAGAKVVKFSERVFSTNFTWVVPVSEIQDDRLNAKELALCEKVAEWMSRPDHNLDWEYGRALKYAKQLMVRVGYNNVQDLWIEDANATYPSVTRFLENAKAIEDTQARPTNGAAHEFKGFLE